MPSHVSNVLDAFCSHGTDHRYAKVEFEVVRQGAKSPMFSPAETNFPFTTMPIKVCLRLGELACSHSHRNEVLISSIFDLSNHFDWEGTLEVPQTYANDSRVDVEDPMRASVSPL